jgi:hypothetical protein
LRADLIEVFYFLEGFEGIEEELFFRRHIFDTRGHSMESYKDRVNRNVLKYGFANRVVEQYDKLPGKVISASSILVKVA